MPEERDAPRNKVHVDDDCLAGDGYDGDVAMSSHGAVVISPARSAVGSFDQDAGWIRSQSDIIRAERAVKSERDYSL